MCLLFEYDDRGGSLKRKRRGYDMVPKKMFGTFRFDLRFTFSRRKGTVMKIFLKLALALGFVGTLAACNTIDGVGKDVEVAGEEIQDAAD